jgi:cation transport ATPase
VTEILQAEGVVRDSSDAHRHIPQYDILRIVLVIGAGSLLGSGTWNGFGHARLAGLAVMLAGGYPIFKEALENVRQRRMTMELSMTIALVAALVFALDLFGVLHDDKYYRAFNILHYEV